MHTNEYENLLQKFDSIAEPMKTKMRMALKRNEPLTLEAVVQESQEFGPGLQEAATSARCFARIH